MQISDNNTSEAASYQNTSSRKRRRVALAPYEGEIRDWVDEDCSDEWIASALGTTASSIQSFRSRRGIRRGKVGEDRGVSSSQPGGSGPSSGLSGFSTLSTYEGVLEHGEEEGYGLWLDPAVAEDPIFQRGFGRVTDVYVSIQKERIVLTPMPGSRPEDPDEQAELTGDSASRLEMFFGASARRAATDPGEERGSVKWYNPDKGYGFIFRPSGREIFFHRTAIKGAGTLEAGTEVSYEVGENERGPVATGVRERG